MANIDGKDVTICNDSDIDNYFEDSDNCDDTNIETTDLDQELQEEVIIGIDLGTTNCCVSVWRNGNYEIIPDMNGNKTIPSIVSFTNNTRYIGREAKNQIELNTENTIYEVKRLIGRKIDEDVVVNDIPYLTYKLDSEDDKNIIIKTNLKDQKSYTPEEISAIILSEIKYMAEDYLKRPIDKAIITVPAYFNDSQRQATKDAATIAGLECMRIINEPTAAALAYGIERKSINKGKDMNIIIYDLGGGTLDVSLLNVCDGVFEVLASTGNTHLGGADFDNSLIKYCIGYFRKKHKLDNLDGLFALSLQRLKKSCENAKKVLSITSKAIIAVKDFYDDKDMYLTITRTQFEKICRDLLILCLKPVEDVLKSGCLQIEDIDEIILVGGATRMPSIRNNLKLFFKGIEPNCSINPDEVVGVGAAIQGYILSHGSDPFSENVVLLDIIPLSLGVETIGGVMNVLIPRNSVIPIKRKKKYTTDTDYSTSVAIKIFEGERKMTSDNFFVGDFELSGLEEAPRGVAEIVISFNVDSNGIISVTAEDLKNNINKNSITITGNKGRLSKDKIKQLVMEAKEMELKDKLERAKKRAFYEIEDLCSNIKINVANGEFKLRKEDKTKIYDEVVNILDWLIVKKYSDREKKEYDEVLERIKKKYGTLIMRSSGEMDNVGGNKQKGSGTSVFEQDEDEDNVYEELEKEEYGFTDDIDENTKKELILIRDTLVELCHNVVDIITNSNIKMDENNIEELKDYIDDILLWVYVQEKISKTEYSQKINEINKICDDMVSKYDDILFEKIEESKKSELENLCCTLLSTIKSNLFSIGEEKIKELENVIIDSLEWLTGDQDLNDTECKKRLDHINKLCDDLYSSMIGIDNSNVIFNVQTDVSENIQEDILEPIMNTKGTTISQLRNK